MASGMDDPQLDTERYDDDSTLPVQYRRVGNTDVGFQPRSDPRETGLPAVQSPPQTNDQYRTGPTFGERIGAKPGAMQPAPAAPAAAPAPPPIQIDASKLPPGILPSTAKVDATVPSYGAPQAPGVQLPPAAMPSGILRTSVSPGEVPSPAASSPATTTLPGLMQRRSQAATPLDPSSNQYRMGWGQRLLGTAANFLHGFAGDKAEPIYVGPGATNSRFARDTSMQEKKVAGLDTDIGNQEKLAGLQEKGYEDALKQAYEGQLGDARIQTADAATARAQAAGETADVRAQLATTQGELNASRAKQATSTANKNDATRPTKVMGNRTYERQDNDTWKDIGPAPVKATGSGRGSKSDFDKIERDKQTTLRQAELRYQKAILDVDPKDAEGIKLIKEQLEQEKAQAQADYEARIQEKGGTVSAPSQATVKAPPPNRVVPAKVPPAKANEPRVRVREKATGKTGTLPKSQVAQAIATGRYEQAQ
jgi:hypothetical protein